MALFYTFQLLFTFYSPVKTSAIVYYQHLPTAKETIKNLIIKYCCGKLQK